ncbi:MAG: 3-deoxy-7-phosphoheptulonate synthase, partial [Kiritimatiellia bacterium]
MIAVLSKDAPLRHKAAVVRLAEDAGLTVHVSDTPGYCLIGVVGEGAEALADPISKLDGVVEVDLSAPAYALVSRAHRPVSSRVRVGDAEFGDGGVHVIAGPCSVEGLEQILTAAHAVKAAGACALRGGAYKPRTSPYAFQGLGAEGLELLSQAREATGLPVVTEVLDLRDLERVAESADVMQVGARNMQNYALLRELGGVRRTVLLKRGMAGTLDELLHAAEYIVSNGNPNVILCERGVRTHISHARATLDLAAIAVLKERTHLPVIVDPSHAAGRRALVGPLALAAV